LRQTDSEDYQAFLSQGPDAKVWIGDKFPELRMRFKATMEEIVPKISNGRCRFIHIGRFYQLDPFMGPQTVGTATDRLLDNLSCRAEAN
jgi:hypothetical protein